MSFPKPGPCSWWSWVGTSSFKAAGNSSWNTGSAPSGWKTRRYETPLLSTRPSRWRSNANASRETCFHFSWLRRCFRLQNTNTSWVAGSVCWRVATSPDARRGRTVIIVCVASVLPSWRARCNGFGEWTAGDHGFPSLAHRVDADGIEHLRSDCSILTASKLKGCKLGSPHLLSGAKQTYDDKWLSGLLSV